MASATVSSENNQWSPSDAVAQGIAQEYSSQWHILEQLKSSVAVVDPFADTNRTQRESVVQGSQSETAKNVEIETEESKMAEKEWFILADVPSSGHTSDSGSDSALEISDLKNELNSFNSSNQTTPNSSRKTKEQSKGNKNEDNVYQEQWHVLEELKASVKAMQWSSHTSDSSLDVSHQPTPSRASSKKGDFAEPHKRTSVTNSNLISDSVSSFRNTEDENTFHSVGSSKVGTSFVGNSIANTSLPVQHTQITIHSEQNSKASQPGFYQETAITTDMYSTPELNSNQNTSSDLSLESENLGFADLPNRPATIGNYGASDAVNNSPLSLPGMPLQPVNIQVNTSPNVISVSSSLGLMNSGSTVLLADSSENILSKAPISARERLQPDGRDGPDVLTAPQGVKTVPNLVSYPSTGSSTDNAQLTGLQPSAGFDGSSTSSNLSQVGQLLVGDVQGSPHSASYVSSVNPVSRTLETSSPSSNNDGLSPSNVTGNLALGDTGNSPQLAAVKQASSAENSKELHSNINLSPSLQSNFMPEQIKGSQSSPWQHILSSTGDHSSISHIESNVSRTSTSWLPSATSPTAHALIDLPPGTSNQGGGSLTRDEIRDAVMERIEAHTQISDISGKDEPLVQTTSSYLETKMSHSDRGSLYFRTSDSSGTCGDIETRVSEFNTRYIGNGQEMASSTIPVLPTTSYHGIARQISSSLNSQQGVPFSYSPKTQGTGSVLGVSPVSSISDRQPLQDEIPGLNNLHAMSLSTYQTAFPKQNISSSIVRNSAGMPYGPGTTHASVQENFSRPPVLEDPVPPRTHKDFFSRPSALDNIRGGLLNSEDDEQSPVSKLLGPNFKATQQYLSKLRNERLQDISFGSTGSSENESRVPTSLLKQHPLHEGYRKQESSNEISPKFHSNSLSDKSLERRHEMKQAWSSQASELSETSHDREELREKDEILKRHQDSFEQHPLKTPPDISNVPAISSEPSVRSNSSPAYLIKYDTKSIQGSEKSESTSYLRHSSMDSLLGSSSQVLQNGLSRYETPLSGLQRKEKSWNEADSLNALKNKRTMCSTESSGIVSSHDEAEDTDDLLSYEAVLEGDIKYIRQRKNEKQNKKLSKEMSSRVNFSSSSIENKTPETTPWQLSGDISSINGSAERELLRQIPVSVASNSSDLPGKDEQTRRYHLSLGAGIVSPVVVSENEKFQETPEGPSVVVPQGSPEDSGAELSSDGIEVEDIEEQEEHIHNPSERESPTTESSSSSLYQPYIPIALREPASVDRESEITGNSSSTYGVYDIRQSSGPGSTNRRRKAMGLSPIPGRVPRPSNGVVYVSAESTSPVYSSVQEDVSAAERSKEDTLTSQSRNESSNDKQIATHRQRRPGSRDRNSNRHSEEERDSRKKSPSKEKDDNSRTRTRGGSFQEAKAINDYIGGRKLVQQSKPRHVRRSKSEELSDESPSLKEYSTSTKNTDLNQMWDRYQESLKSSSRYTKADSVSSHLSRLSALLSKPLDAAITTSSETEIDLERFRKPRSHSYASSSSELSTESDQMYNEFTKYVKSSSLSRQIKLRKLLETVNVADVPTFPRLRHRDTTTTTTTTTSAFSDTSVNEAPASSRDTTRINLPRSNRGLRKVSKTPVFVPSSQSRIPVEQVHLTPKCICAIHSEKPSEPVRSAPVIIEKHFHQRPRTFDVAVNVPSPKLLKDKSRGRKKEGFVDVGVQTVESDEESNVHIRIRSKSDGQYEKRRNKKQLEGLDLVKRPGKDASTPKRKERLIASQNSPPERHVCNGDSSLRSFDGLNNTNQSDSLNPSPSKKEKFRSKHNKERPIASQNSSISKSNCDIHHSPSGPVWFYPMTNRHYSQPVRSSGATNRHHNKPTLQASVVKPERLRFDEQTTKTFSPPAAAPSTSMQKLSLQEAFCFAKNDFIKRSRARIMRIEHNRGVRENGESKAKGEERVSKMEIPAGKPSVSKPTINPRTEKLHRPKPRQISKKEMKKMNLKLYNNLPEVKAQKAEDRRTAFYKSNRLRAKLFDKRVRENLKKRYAA